VRAQPSTGFCDATVGTAGSVISLGIEIRFDRPDDVTGAKAEFRDVRRTSDLGPKERVQEESGLGDEALHVYGRPTFVKRANYALLAARVKGTVLVLTLIEARNTPAQQSRMLESLESAMREAIAAVRAG
jgi:hypothetical protein